VLLVAMPFVDKNAVPSVVSSAPANVPSGLNIWTRSVPESPTKIKSVLLVATLFKNENAVPHFYLQMALPPTAPTLSL